MDTVGEVVPLVVPSRRPPGGSFRQQRMASWQPVMTPIKIIGIFLAVGVCFVPTGTSILKTSDAVFEQRIVYDGSNKNDVQCQIGKANEAKKCTISFVVDEDIKGPLLVYYELTNYYQNHRRYVTSYSSSQLLGANIGASDTTVATVCNPVAKNGNMSLNPCGLIANSFFTDIITLPRQVGYSAVMDETAIATAAERAKLFKQVDGFESKIVDSATADCVANGLPATCKRYTDKAGLFYLYNYPDDDTVQYLHETYPKQISPLEGITNEHFMIWMRTAALPTFRKLYGRIYRDFKKGEAVTFEVEANFEVRSYNADKAIIITKQGQFGAKNSGLGIAYITIGSMCLFFGFLFTVKQLILPRPLGTRKALGWEN